MTDLLNEILSSNTAISLVSSFIAFMASYKMLQKDVKQNTEDIKEIKQLDIKVRIMEMQKDIQYMREKMDLYLSKLNKD